MTELIRCNNGHKFSVNKNKHQGETHVLCPKCLTKVQIRKKFPWSPNSNWQKQKQDRAEQKQRFKKMRKRKEDLFMQPSIFAPAHAQVMGLLALSQLMKKREEE